MVYLTVVQVVQKLSVVYTNGKSSVTGNLQRNSVHLTSIMPCSLMHLRSKSLAQNQMMKHRNILVLHKGVVQFGNRRQMHFSTVHVVTVQVSSSQRNQMQTYGSMVRQPTTSARPMKKRKGV